MPGNKLLPFLRDISQMAAILPFFPSPYKYQVPRTGQLFRRTDTHSSLFCQQPGNFRRKPWSGLAYGYQSDSKAKTFRNIFKAACVKMSHRSSKMCTTHHCLNGHHFQPHHKLSTEAQGMGDGRAQKTTAKGSLMFNFHHLGMPPLWGDDTVAVWRWCSGKSVCRGCCQPSHVPQAAALTSAPGAVAPSPTAGPGARKNSLWPMELYRRDRTRVKGAKRGKKWRKEAAAQKWDGTGTKPCAAAVPRTLSEVSPYSSRFPPQAGMESLSEREAGMFTILTSAVCSK